MTQFRRYDGDSGDSSPTLAGEIISVASELVALSRDLDKKNSLRGVQTPKSERSLKERLEELIERERSEHPDPAEDMIAAVAHAHGLQLCQLQSVSTNHDIVRCRIEAARTAHFSAGVPTYEIARVLQKDHGLVEHWIRTTPDVADR